MIRLPPPSPLFPYTTLFRSAGAFDSSRSVRSSSADVQRYRELLLRGCRRRSGGDRKSTRLNSSHGYISYAVFCLKKKNILRRNVPTPDRVRSNKRSPWIRYN